MLPLYLGHRPLGASFELALLAVIVFALVGGVTGVAATPIPISPRRGGLAVRPFGALTRRSDVAVRPQRSGAPETGEELHDGLTSLGVAIVVVTELAPVLVIANLH